MIMSADALHRTHETKFVKLGLEQIDAEGTICGYASLFGEVDLGRDAVAHGAFSASLAKRGASGIRMLFQHDPDQPIGRWSSITEDVSGLRVKGEVSNATVKGREVLELLRIGAIDGLSIGFTTSRARTDPATGIRTITQADLWEISIVTFPMLPSARVDGVKSARMPTIREFERYLVRDAGLTRSEAKRAVTSGYASVVAARDASFAVKGADDPDEALARIIRDAARKIHN
jgi:HK97 family phage prohead protease